MSRDEYIKREIERLGNLCRNPSSDSMSGRVYSTQGIAPTVDTVCRELKIVVKE